jgi:hypothetical protein
MLACSAKLTIKQTNTNTPPWLRHTSSHTSIQTGFNAKKISSTPHSPLPDSSTLPTASSATYSTSPPFSPGTAKRNRHTNAILENNLARHIGQVACSWVHVLKHTVWKVWLQCRIVDWGRVQVKASRQIGHGSYGTLRFVAVRVPWAKNTSLLALAWDIFVGWIGGLGVSGRSWVGLGMVRR